MTLRDLVEAAARQLADAQVAFGHGTDNAWDEAAWLTLWSLGLPLDTPLDSFEDDHLLTPDSMAGVARLVQTRIATRKPAAYLTRQAWLQGLAFYVDERAIVPRSLIAEVLTGFQLEGWLTGAPARILDMCTGNGSLAVLAALAYPQACVEGVDISEDALAVARINVAQHELQSRIELRCSDGFGNAPGPYDLILCNPPYVNAHSMAILPPEYRQEPAIALDGNRQGGLDGMDFVRQLLRDAPARMRDDAVLVLEIGHEREGFEAAFPALQSIWLETSAGEDQIVLLTRTALQR